METHGAVFLGWGLYTASRCKQSLNKPGCCAEHKKNLAAALRDNFLGFFKDLHFLILLFFLILEWF